MTSKKVTIKLESGLEARPVAMLVQVASQYDSDIYVESASKRINACLLYTSTVLRSKILTILIVSAGLCCFFFLPYQMFNFHTFTS